jgi:succinoglycan biosynthesis protein ExoA
VTSAHAPLSSVLVVLPCLNEAMNLPAILDALLRDEPAEGLLIVVADGGSTDGTIEVVERAAARDPRVKLLRNARRLQSAGVNLAATLFGEGRDWLIRMDAHAEYPPGFVSRLVETGLAVGADSVVTSMITLGRTCFQRAVASAQNSRLGTGGAAHRRRSGGEWVDHGHHALFALATFRAVGGYDESFAANEDAELDVRLARSGGRIWLAGDLAITYHPRATLVSLFRQYLRHGSGRARTILRHKLRPRVRQALPILVAPSVALLASTPYFPILAAPAAIWASVCVVYGAWLGVRQRRPCTLMAGAAAMVMHLAWSCGFWSRILRGPPRLGIVGAASDGDRSIARRP